MKTHQFDRENFFSEILDKTKIGILVLERSKKEVIFLNKYFKKLAGDYSQHIIESVFSSLGSKIDSHIHNDIKIGENMTYEFTICPVKGMEDRFVVLISDISSKKIYMELVNNENHYRKLSKFASEITHEAGNPLTSIIMTLQVLIANMDSWDSEQNREYLKVSINELKRLSNFIKKIRNISKDQKVSLEEINLKSFFHLIINRNKPELEKKKIAINEDIKKDIRVIVDQEAFFKIIMNLIHNSIKILSPGTGIINIKVEKISEFFLKLVYENNGPPIPERMKEKMFMPIISGNINGSEIGLDLSSRLMSKMGGTIEVDNLEEGRGVRFVIYIPNAEGNEIDRLNEL